MRTQSHIDARHPGHLRALNLERVLAVAMERPGPLTRQELGEATGLSAPTIANVTAELVRRGLLRDAGSGPSRGGRRPGFVEFNARHGLVLGVDLGPEKTHIAVADLRGDILARRVLPTPAGTPATLLRRVGKAARTFLRVSRVAGGGLLAAAAAAPGVVDRERGIVVDLTPNLKGWTRVRMAEHLGRALGAPVVVENDVNLAVIGERWRGAARGHDTCAFVSVGAGIGAGVVMGGELHRGHHFLAGEIALMCLGPQYVERDFGTHGCLETLAGMDALASRWKGTAAGARGEDWIRGLFEAARSGDRRARQAITETATLLGIATTNLALVLDPSLIVIGGPLGEGLVEEVRRIVGRVIPAPPEILASQLGQDATLWGCLLTAGTEARARLRRGMATGRS